MKKTLVKICLMILVIAMFGHACGNLSSDSVSATIDTPKTNSHRLNITFQGCSLVGYHKLCRYHDEDKKATCWITYYRNSISCVPDKDLE